MSSATGGLMRSKFFLKCLKKHSRAIFEFFCLARLRLNTYQIVFVRLLLIPSSDRLCKRKWGTGPSFSLDCVMNCGPFAYSRSICVTNASRACGQRWTRADWPVHIFRDLSGTTDNNRVIQSAEACNSIVEDNAHMIQKIFEINKQTTRTQLKVIKEVVVKVSHR